MIESNLQEITERLDKVEKQNRYMKLAGVAFLSVVVVALLAGAAKKPEVVKEIKAHRIVMVDSEGKERIVMEEGRVRGWSMFSMLNSEGVITFRTMVTDQTVSMTLSPNQNGLTLWAGEQRSEFKMYGKNNTEQIHLKTSEFESVLDVTGPNKKNLARIIAGDHAASIATGGIEKNRVRMTGGLEDMNGGGFAITNKTGEEVIQLRVDEYGNGVVGAYNRKGMGRTLQPGP